MNKYRVEKVVETKENKVLESVVCNKCGREFTDNLLGWKHNKEIMDIHEFHGDGSFYSKIGEDRKWKFDLCDDCVIELMISLKIPPEIHNYGFTADFLENESPFYNPQESFNNWLKKKREELSTHKLNE